MPLRRRPPLVQAGRIASLDPDRRLRPVAGYHQVSRSCNAAMKAWGAARNSGPSERPRVCTSSAGTWSGIAGDLSNWIAFTCYGHAK
jgi:hypothetical protein